MSDTAYPLRLDMSAAVVVGLAALFLAFASSCLVVSVSVYWPHPWPQGAAPFVQPLLAMIFGAMAAGSGCVAWVCLKSETLLWPDRIEYSNGFRRRTLFRDDIEGYRQIGDSENFRLISKTKGNKSITVAGRMLRSELAGAWFDGLVDLNARDLAASEARLLEDEQFGSSPEARRARLALLRRVVFVLNGAAYASAAWCLLKPQPYLWAIATAAAIPPLAVLVNILTGSQLALDTSRNDARPAIGIVLIAPLSGLGLRAIFDVQLWDLVPFWEWAVGAGIVLTVLLAASDSRLRRSRVSMASFCFFAIIYAASVLALADVSLDQAQGEIFPTTVADKHVDSGKVTRYELTLGPWGPQKDQDTVDVTFAFYNHVKVGDRVCVYFEPGRLGFRWYDVGYCSAEDDTVLYWK